MNLRHRYDPVHMRMVFVLFIAYSATAALGLMLQPVSGFATLVWPPTGIALAAVLRWGYRMWPGIAAGAFVVNFSYNAPFLAAAGISAGNTLESLAAAYLLQRFFGFEKSLCRLRDVLGLIFVAAGLCTAISPLAGVLSLSAAGIVQPDHMLETLRAWWIGDMLGALVIAPVILTWKQGALTGILKKRLIEAITLAVFILVTLILVFGDIFPMPISRTRLAYLVFPPVIWAALRFGQLGAVCATFLMTAAGIAATLLGHGPFPAGTLVESLGQLQIFMAVVALSSMIMGAVVEERLRSEARTRRNEQRLDAFFSQVLVGMAQCDADGRILLVNPRFCGICGRTNAELSRLTMREILHPADVDRFDDMISKLRAGESSAVFEHRVVRPDGGCIWVNHYVSAVRDEGKIIRQTVSTLEDISERKKIDILKSEFISTVSHDLRTPLTSIKSSLDLIHEGVAGPVSDKARHLIRIAFRNCERLARLVNDILDTQKIEAGKIDFHFQPLEMLPLLEQAVEFNQFFADNYGVKFVISRRVAEAMVQVDSDRLMQVLNNLLSNAAKFSPPHCNVLVAMECHNNSLRTAVRDFGPGIPEEFRDRMFQKFSQVEPQDRLERAGSGLGLWISRMIIEQHGGRIGFTSSPREGTTFYFDLPLWTGEHVGTAPPEGTGESRNRILICEDERDMAELFSLILLDAGFETQVAHSATQAKQMLAESSFHAMILDIGLPDQDGISLARELRQSDSTRDLPIVVVSARAHQAFEDLQGENLGIREWIDKPITSQSLANSLRKAVR